MPPPSNDSRPDDLKPQPASQSLEANSGASFVRKLGLRIDPARAPRLHLFAWNVGERKKSPDRALSGTAASIPQILSQAQMLGLAAIYFEKVHPCYAFLNRETLLSRIVRHWSNKTSAESDPAFESVLCGIAALAYLFSQREIMDIETKLAEDARLFLEKSVLCGKPPSIDTITAWVLRTAYLRMTASPHAAWMASCTLMHLIEAAGLHLEASDLETATELGTSSTGNHTIQNSIYTSPNSDLDTRRRLFGMARHLNTWISFDLGRSRVVLHGATSQPPTQAQTSSGAGADLFHLLPLSDPTYTEPSLILVQCNLMLCIYRRARALNPYSPLRADLQDRILALASRALTAARKMVAASCPWHQVANVPFQVVCTLLAIDNRAALGLLSDAMMTLREVQAAYDTGVMREAYSTAYLLVALHQRRKEDDTRALAEVLRANASAAGGVSGTAGYGVGGGIGYDTTDGHGNTHARGNTLDGASLHQNVRPEGQTAQQMQLQQDAADADLSWLGDLMIDMPSLQNFDLEQFLGTTVPWPLPEMGI
ncbi:Transcription factor [Penicillium cosmopolitanum]|uniref:Transcription factor n=1 Tax=Penicillium cosmopolitanum TaxID=1131564 RepID=A0A9W9VE22_9EURO|nr:Transcription factor [Penicillium cosmopolitanum]KAJ5378728.1 Transcription factor [Penicillium cosmopolitanum]